jgi:tRNA threonylcarbamoyladenosine biosynthesis protein TsaE
MVIRCMSGSPEETRETGLKIGKLLKPGDVVCLYGELGSGKTTLVKGIARAFGINENDVVSASFTIITEYDTQPAFSHIDLYRIEKGSELDDIGFWEQIKEPGISVIEWAEKADQWLPDNIIRIRLTPSGEHDREIELEVNDEKNWNNL